MNKNERGLGAVEVIAVIVTISLLGLGGWHVWHSKHPDSKSKSTTSTEKSKAEATPSSSSDETASWVTFTPNSGLYTVKLPDGWTFLHQDDQCDCLFSQSTTYKAGTPATVTRVQGGRDGIIGYFISVDSSDMSESRFKGFENLGPYTAGNLKGTKYHMAQTTDNEGLGLENGGEEWAYYFVKDGKGIYISYSINPGTTSNLELVEKSIQTLR